MFSSQSRCLILASWGNTAYRAPELYFASISGACIAGSTRSITIGLKYSGGLGTAHEPQITPKSSLQEE